MVGWIEGTTTGRKLGRTVTKLAQVQHRAKKDQIEVTLSHEYVNTYDGSLDPCRTYLLAFFDSTIERFADDDVDQTLPRKKAWQFCLAL